MTDTMPVSPGEHDAVLAALVAKQQITEVLYRRARAGDRRDIELALSCYHPDATEKHEGFTGLAADFVQNVSMISPTSAAPVTALWHFISNVLIELNGDAAEVESYHIALVTREERDGETHSFIGGRYLDMFTQRDGRWAIAHREVVFDWSRVGQATTTYWDLVGLDGGKLVRGKFGPEDPLYHLLGISTGARDGDV